MLRLTRWLTVLLGLALLAASSASAVAAASGQNLASGSPGSVEHRIGENSLASSDHVSEKLDLFYDLTSDFPVAARGTSDLFLRASKAGPRLHASCHTGGSFVKC